MHFSVLGTGGGLDRAEPDARIQLYEEIQHMCEYLQETGQLADPDDPDELADRKYFYGRLAMFSVPFNAVKPTTQYMVGETQRTLVALGGHLKDVVNRDAEFAKAADGARVIQEERDVAVAIAIAQRLARAGEAEPRPSEAEPERWELAVAQTYHQFSDDPHHWRLKDYEVLALKDEFTPAEALAGFMHPAKDVLLGKPLFVAEG